MNEVRDLKDMWHVALWTMRRKQTFQRHKQKREGWVHPRTAGMPMLFGIYANMQPGACLCAVPPIAIFKHTNLFCIQYNQSIAKSIYYFVTESCVIPASVSISKKSPFWHIKFCGVSNSVILPESRTSTLQCEKYPVRNLQSISWFTPFCFLADVKCSLLCELCHYQIQVPLNSRSISVFKIFFWHECILSIV